MCIASCYARRIDILDNPRRNVDCGERLGEGKVPSPRALSILSTRSERGKIIFSTLSFLDSLQDKMLYYW